MDHELLEATAAERPSRCSVVMRAWSTLRINDQDRGRSNDLGEASEHNSQLSLLHRSSSALSVDGLVVPSFASSATGALTECEQFEGVKVIIGNDGHP